MVRTRYKNLPIPTDFYKVLDRDRKVQGPNMTWKQYLELLYSISEAYMAEHEPQQEQGQVQGEMLPPISLKREG